MKKINRSITAFVVIGFFLLSCSVLLLGIGCADTSIKGSMNNVDTLHFNETIYENEEKIGVLVIAHGSPNDCWCQPILEAVENVSVPYPTKLGFLEFVENKSIGDAIEELDNLGVDKIIAVPLFISSYSGHIQEIEYVLKLIENPPGDEELAPVDTPAEIIFTRAMDDHPLVAYMLADQIVNLSRTTNNATAVILSHGTEDEKDLLSQINCQKALADETKTILKWSGVSDTKIKDVKYAFIHLNETLHPELTPKAVVENASLEGDVIIVPLMISEGFFTERQIPMLLEGKEYEYNGYALASHPNVAKWIETSVRCAMNHEKNSVLIVVDHGSPEKERMNAIRKTSLNPLESDQGSIQIYDKQGGLINRSIEETAKVSHGDLCLCAIVAARVSQVAIIELFGEDIPTQGDLEVTYRHPGKGHKDCFEYILLPECATYEPTGDPNNLTLENFVYTFVRKDNGVTFEPKVKDSVIPEKFFDLRYKVNGFTKGWHNNPPTEAEKTAFKQNKSEARNNILTMEANQVFERV